MRCRHHTDKYIYNIHCIHTPKHGRHTDTEEVKMRHTRTTKNNYFESHVQHLLPLLSIKRATSAAAAVAVAFAVERKYQ